MIKLHFTSKDQKIKDRIDSIVQSCNTGDQLNTAINYGVLMDDRYYFRDSEKWKEFFYYLESSINRRISFLRRLERFITK